MDKKARGVLAYLLGWIGGLIVLVGFKDNDRKTVTHACQAITISVASSAFSIAIGMINGFVYAASGFSISFISSIFSILCFVLQILGLVKVLNDDPNPKLVVAGDITMSIFGKKIESTPETVSKGVTAKFDPNTGQPINSQPQANFDPNTGQPITQPQANFDPNTGQPITQPQANFDPNTGQPVTTPTDQNTI